MNFFYSILIFHVLFVYTNQALCKTKQVKLTPNKSHIFNSEPKVFLANGINLKFHYWPKKKEKTIVFQRVKKANFKTLLKIKELKFISFKWSEPQSEIEALKWCQTLKNLPFIDYCEVNSLFYPINSFKQARDTFLPDGHIKKQERTEANSLCHECIFNNKTNVLSIIPFVPFDLRTCGILSAKEGLKKGHLSDYWAQEMIGADLLRDELKKTKHLIDDQKLLVAVLDTFERHSVPVKNLISSSKPQAILPELMQNQIRSFRAEDPSEVVSLGYKLKDSQPSFINYSMVIKDSAGNVELQEHKQCKDTLLGFSLMSSSVIVAGAGNDYYDVQGPIFSCTEKMSMEGGAVIVGSMSPLGLVSDCSQTGKEVSILAPSDHYIMSVNKEGETSKFGGTSGATPLVTGALAGFELLSGYHPSSEEAKILLEKTAIQTLYSQQEDSYENGKGLLNAYKIGRVGQHLRNKCKEDKACFQREIRKDENYKFPVDDSLQMEISEAFPECSNQNHYGIKKNLQCEDKKIIFNKIRKAAFLNPFTKKLWKTLGCIYGKSGFSVNQAGMKMIATALSSREKVVETLENLYDKYKTDDQFKNTLIRTAGTLLEPEEGKNLWNLLVESKSRNLFLLTAIDRVSEEKQYENLKHFAKHKDPLIREDVAYIARRLETKKGLEILNLISVDNDPNIEKIISESKNILNGMSRK